MRPEAERHVAVGAAGDVELVGRRAELVAVAVRRCVQEHHRFTLADARPAHLDIARRRTHEVDDGGRPPQELLHRGHDAPAIVAQGLPLVRALRQRHQATRQHVATGLVAGDEQLHQEHGELVVGETLTVDLGRPQRRDEVVARLVAPGLGLSHQVGHHLRLQRLAFVVGKVEGARDHSLRPQVEAGPLVVGDPEQLGDDLQREGHGDRRHHVACRAGLEAVEQGAGPHAHHRLERPDERRREAGLRERAVPRVLRRVSVHHRRWRRVVGSDLEEQDPSARAEGGRIGRRGQDVRVLAEHPEADLRVARHGRLGAQPRVGREGIAGERPIVEQEGGGVVGHSVP